MDKFEHVRRQGQDPVHREPGAGALYRDSLLPVDRQTPLKTLPSPLRWWAVKKNDFHRFHVRRSQPDNRQYLLPDSRLKHKSETLKRELHIYIAVDLDFFFSRKFHSMREKDFVRLVSPRFSSTIRQRYSRVSSNENMVGCQLLWQVREQAGLSVTVAGKRTSWAVSYCGR